MKHIKRSKLHLSHDTVRLLHSRDLDAVAGAGRPPTKPIDCASIELCTLHQANCN